MIADRFVNRSQIAIAAIAMAVSLVLIIIPPLTVGGLSLWLYLMPAAVAAYCLPHRVFVALVACGIAFGYLLSSQYAPAFVAEATASAFLLLAMSFWRSVTSRVDTVLLAVTLITFVAYPWVALINHYFGDVSVLQALFIATRYSVGSLVSILLAELFIITATLSPHKLFKPLREALNFRPLLVHVVELILGASIAFSLLLMLSLFWSVWDRDVKQSIVDTADVRIQSLFSAAELAVAREMRRIDSTLTLASSRLDDAQMTELLDGLANEFMSYVDNAPAADGAQLELGALTRDGRIFASTGLSDTQILDLMSRARSATSSGLVKLVDGDMAGQQRPVYVLLDNVNSDLILRFPNLDSVHSFTYGEALERYSALYGDPIKRTGIIDIDGVKDRDLPDTAVVLHHEADGWVLWKPGTVTDEASRLRAYSARSDASVQLTAPPSRGVITRFEPLLHGVSEYTVTLRYWQFVKSYINIVVITTAASFVLLVLLLWSTRLMVSSLVRPLAALTSIFESWRELRGADQNTGMALQALDSKGFSSLSDIHSLQVGFRSLAQDVIFGERRLSTIAANYDELLRSLPLGVLAIDGDSRVQFSNDAMGEITERQQEAIERIKAQAAHMLAMDKTVDEWQLNLSDRPPKNLLLVVNHRLDDHGQEFGLWVIATDLTAQKQTNAQLIQASKLATLGEMSTGMAHELNQPLNVISLATSNLRFAIKKGKLTPDNTLSKLERIDGAVHRAASIIDHMRSYGRLSGETLTEINVGEIVGGSCNLLAEQLKLVNINLINRVPSSGLSVRGNAIQLEQVLINLINNGKDAILGTGDAGNIVVESEINDDRVLIRVTDSGGGIPDHVMPHIFEPFFTTKPVGKGTGLGGSISYGIVREMHGDIWAENSDGGAQITISLPLMVKN